MGSQNDPGGWLQQGRRFAGKDFADRSREFKVGRLRIFRVVNGNQELFAGGAPPEAGDD